MVRTCNVPYPTNCDYEQIFTNYPFPLSDFQKYAIEAIEKDKHILVTAHTGSGKTLPKRRMFLPQPSPVPSTTILALVTKPKNRSRL